MAIGLTLKNDDLSVFVLDRLIDRADDAVNMNLEVLAELGTRIISNLPENKCDLMSVGEVAEMLPGFDVVTAY